MIGWGDYADGIAARVTGQYSRLGALMDPLTDRLLAISGVVVCWHFALLPRWALAVLVARELSMLVLGRYGLARGVELRINWPGRLSVAPLMGVVLLRDGRPRRARRGAAVRRPRARAARHRRCTCATAARAAIRRPRPKPSSLSLTLWAIVARRLIPAPSAGANKSARGARPAWTRFPTSAPSRTPS